MRVLRNLLYLVALVGGSVLASVNMTPVRFIYLPDVPFFAAHESAAAEIPLALLLLAFLVVGAVLAGTGTFVEHVRLRFLVRRNAKVVKSLRAEVEKLRAELETSQTSLETRSAEFTSEQARARKAEEAAATARSAEERERLRADEAELRLPAPEAQE